MCEYCENQKIIDKGEITLTIHENTMTVITQFKKEAIGGAFDINYCPKCGIKYRRDKIYERDDI